VETQRLESSLIEATASVDRAAEGLLPPRRKNRPTR
jgi:hypothetical protein